MADLPESAEWIEGIYQIETSDPVLGGVDGISNRQAKQLASRTGYLRQRLEAATVGLRGHEHSQYALAASLEGLASKEDLQTHGKALNPHPQYMHHFSAAAPLPSTNIGPIWHDDYNSLMIWQKFDQHGAIYEGYASSLIGSLLLDTQPTPRAGYIKSGTPNLSRSTYAALRAWAMHHGRMVTDNVWRAGEIVVTDNPDGATFKIFDVRGEFLRAWDDGRGVDGNRTSGSHQMGSVVWQPGYARHSHDVNSLHGAWDMAYNDGRGSFGVSYDDGFAGNVAAGSVIKGYAVQVPSYTVPYVLPSASVDGALASYNIYKGTRPRNTALLATIKF